MLSDQNKRKKVVGRGNHNPAASNGELGEIKLLLGQVIATQKEQADEQQDIKDQLNEVEKGQAKHEDAATVVTKSVYTPDREHLPEFTIITARMVDPFALADACAAFARDDVRSGKVSIGQVRQESIYRHLRSMKGKLLEKGADHALQMEQNRSEASTSTPWAVGGGE